MYWTHYILLFPLCILQSSFYFWWFFRFHFHYKPKVLPLFTILNSPTPNNSPVPFTPLTESKQDMKTISPLKANRVWIEPWMLYDRHSVAEEQSEWRWYEGHMDPTGCIWNCVLARTHILWKRTLIICVPLITTMEWCNPLRKSFRTLYSKLPFWIWSTLTLLFVFFEF